MRKSAAVKITAILGSSLLAASLTAFLNASLGAPNDLGADRQTIRPRSDQLAVPTAQTGAEAAAPAATRPDPALAAPFPLVPPPYAARGQCSSTV